MNAYRAEVQSEIYAKLENYTCIPKDTGCVFHGFYYDKCENVGTPIASLLQKNGS
jgi:hypothetical protein